MSPGANGACSCFGQMLGRLFCFGYLGLKTPQIVVGKKKRSFVIGSTGTYRIRLQNLRIYLPKTAWTFGLLCGKQVKFASLPLII